MEAYQELVATVLEEGSHKRTRTGVDTISSFMYAYELDVADGFPLLTTKRMDGGRWDSIVHELRWYLSGEEHIRTLREETGIWDDWADEEGRLPTAYGRFWRRFPLPEQAARLPGEWWPDAEAPWLDEAAAYYDVSPADIRTAMDRWITTEGETTVFDQLAYVIDTLNGEHPFRPPDSRRLVVSAWHPANAAVSKLPPCHYTFVFNVENGKLNLHMTQRSGDVALGIPFNIAAYALLLRLVARETDYAVGRFGHTIVDAHVYCGTDDRGRWYAEHLDEVQDRLGTASTAEDRRAVAAWLADVAPPEETPNADHVPNLIEQLARTPYARPTVEIADKPLDDLTAEDFTLCEYEAHPSLRFAVAE